METARDAEPTVVAMNVYLVWTNVRLQSIWTTKGAADDHALTLYPLWGRENVWVSERAVQGGAS